ncbi:3a2dc915-4ef3-4170-868e-cf7ee33f23b9 [Sclerotinia trifoliorum]|uniref:3a2dc915-4ef3-4170-868e-cf7ee33f23b9 n=1 Tax=Sclerotinia trifoliorum TaxID=28548 RepID=A0A8H2VXT1_9HELO|nr:3a2dc915-4ef3-4170-868e-cf7ee33f23b9 [Sclerotinia trifoliorum]
MSNLVLLQVPHSPGPKHNRSSSVYSRNSCDSSFSAFTGSTLVAETCPIRLRTRESRLSCAGPCDGTVFYIYDKPLPPLPREALVKKQKPLPPLPLNISRRTSYQNIRSLIPEPKNHNIYYDEKEVYVHNPFSDEKVVMVGSLDEKENVL